MPDQSLPKCSRQWPRLSVRGLIVLVLVIGAGLGWVVRSARIQREAVAAIEKVGGGVIYDWEWKNGDYIWSGKPWPPKWLMERIGVDYFGQVVVVYSRKNNRMSDAEMVYVGHLAGLVSLSLSGSSATDFGLANLRGLTDLQELELDDTQVTDVGLAHLKGLTKLSRLELDNTQVTDVGLAHLKALTSLSELDLSGTQVTDDGLNELKRALSRLTTYHRIDAIPTGLEAPRSVRIH
jgi:hypothetical protein